MGWGRAPRCLGQHAAKDLVPPPGQIPKGHSLSASTSGGRSEVARASYLPRMYCVTFTIVPFQMRHMSPPAELVSTTQACEVTSMPCATPGKATQVHSAPPAASQAFGMSTFCFMRGVLFQRRRSDYGRSPPAPPLGGGRKREMVVPCFTRPRTSSKKAYWCEVLDLVHCIQQ